MPQDDPDVKVTNTHFPAVEGCGEELFGLSIAHQADKRSHQVLHFTISLRPDHNTCS